MRCHAKLLVICYIAGLPDLASFWLGVLSWDVNNDAPGHFQGEAMNTRRRERGPAAPWLLCILLSLGMLLGPAQSVQAQERTTGTGQRKLTDASGGVCRASRSCLRTRVTSV